jgi:predicted DNA-binding transcriptional regulator YafY
VTRPTARVLALLEILQGGGTHTAADLATRLAVDERTVRRYADHLLDLEVPVESVRGRYGGYRLAPGFRMPPLMLTDEEALAVLLGLVAVGPGGLGPPGGARGGLVGPVGLGKAALGAAAKVRRVLPKALAARLDTLLASFTAPAAPATTRAASTEASVMLRLAEATRLRRPALIAYADRTGRRSERTVHPYGIVAHAGRWYVTGDDSASGRMRTFRLDRIAEVRIVAGTFTVPEDFEPAEAVRASLAGTPWRHQVVVVVQGPAGEVGARLPRGIATIEPDDEQDRWTVVRLRAERLDWLPGVLAGLGMPFVIREPAELRDVVRAWADRVARWAAATAPPIGPARDEPSPDEPLRAGPSRDEPDGGTVGVEVAGEA